VRSAEQPGDPDHRLHRDQHRALRLVEPRRARPAALDRRKAMRFEQLLDQALEVGEAAAQPSREPAIASARRSRFDRRSVAGAEPPRALLGKNRRSRPLTRLRLMAARRRSRPGSSDRRITLWVRRAGLKSGSGGPPGSGSSPPGRRRRVDRRRSSPRRADTHRRVPRPVHQLPVLGWRCPGEVDSTGSRAAPRRSRNAGSPSS